VNVGVEIEAAVERVKNCNDANLQAKLGFYPCLNSFCGKDRQKSRELPVAEERPQHIRHRECYAFVTHIRQSNPALTLPS
jgi:hypothetical protein